MIIFESLLATFEVTCASKQLTNLIMSKTLFELPWNVSKFRRTEMFDCFLLWLISPNLLCIWQIKTIKTPNFMLKLAHFFAKFVCHLPNSLRQRKASYPVPSKKAKYICWWNQPLVLVFVPPLCFTLEIE